MEKYFGFYRAKVVDNKDPQKFGRVKMWIPDIMPDIPDNKGIWARPANNTLGGRNSIDNNENNYSGSCYIPALGSWWFIFFECGCCHLPYYFCPLDLENSKVLPENQLGNNYEDKWTLIKSHDGRCLIVSDDEDDERVEITGKKRQLSEPPSGNTDSVYTIDGNQTSILLDERDGKEKVLIRSHNGDFIHVDIDERQLHISFSSDIHIKSDGDIFIQGKNINIKSNDSLNLQSGDNINIKSNDSLNLQSTSNLNIKSSSTIKNESSSISSLATGIISLDGSLITNQGGVSQSASSASSATSSSPIGNRDT